MANSFYCETVLAAAYKSLDRVRKEYLDKKAEILAPYLKPIKKFWLFGPKIMRTEDEAVTVANTNFTDRCELSVAVHIAYKQCQAINKVISLTKAVKGNDQTHVNLTTEEFLVIRDSWEEN